MQIQKFKTELKDFVCKNKEGFTVSFNVKSLKHTRGFYIALTDNSDKNINQAIAELLKIYKKDFKQIKKEGLFIGGWVDEKTKRFFLDLSIHHNNKTTAFLIASLFKQKAIYDIEHKKSIYLNTQ